MFCRMAELTYKCDLISVLREKGGLEICLTEGETVLKSAYGGSSSIEIPGGLLKTSVTTLDTDEYGFLL